MELCLVWAQDRQGAIGRGAGLPWSLPEHLQRLEQLAAGCPVILGRRTWQWPEARPSGASQIIVLTRSHDAQFANAVRSNTLTDALLMAGASHPAQTFIVGGVTLFELALPVTQRVYVTDVDIALERVEARAPPLPAEQWIVQTAPIRRSTAGPQYQFVEYRKRTTRP